MTKRIAILGSGEWASQLADFIKVDPSMELVGFVDNKPVRGGYFCSDNELVTLYNRGAFDCLFIGIGYARFDLRKKLYEEFSQKQIPFATIIHPTAVVSPSAKIGAGSFIGPNVVVNKEAEICDNVVANSSVLVEHNTIVGNHSYIAGRAAIAGYSRIGECSFIGLNSTIKDHIAIADYTTVGCAANVVKNIEESNHIYIGNPAKQFK